MKHIKGLDANRRRLSVAEAKHLISEATPLDADFPALCAKLGIAPRDKYRPVLTNYPNMPEIDEYWTISRDEFVKLAEAHKLFVETA